MFEVLLDNSYNDKTLKVKLPIVPRKGDWLDLSHEHDFADGEDFMIVDIIILNPLNNTIKVVIDRFD